MDKKPIRLTEQDLHFLVENAVQAYLKEERIDEFMGGATAVGKAAYGKFKNGLNGMRRVYQQGNQQAKLKKLQAQKTNLQAQLENIETQLQQLQGGQQGAAPQV